MYRLYYCEIGQNTLWVYNIRMCDQNIEGDQSSPVVNVLLSMGDTGTRTSLSRFKKFS